MKKIISHLVLLSIAAIVTLLLAGAWWRLWMHHDWPGSIEWLASLLGAHDGERIDLMFNEMFITVFLAILATAYAVIYIKKD